MADTLMRRLIAAGRSMLFHTMRAAAVSVLLVVGGSLLANAADWPARPVRIIAPATPGGAANAEPDGATFVTSSVANHAIAPALSANPGLRGSAAGRYTPAGEPVERRMDQSCLSAASGPLHRATEN